MVNATGKRFVDEGADFRNYTYAKYGRVILEQPGQFAWQIFDAKVAHLKRDEYNIRQITKATANTLEELAPQLDGVDADAFLKEVAAYNAAVKTDIPFDPNVTGGGSVALSWHGFLSFIAVAAAVWLVARSSRRDPTILPDMVYNTAIWVIVGGIIGTKVVITDREGAETRGYLMEVTAKKLVVEKRVTGGSISFEMARANVESVEPI